MTEKREKNKTTQERFQDGLLNVILNLALKMGFDDAIDVLRYHRYKTVPDMANHLGDDFMESQVRAYDFAIEKLREARRALQRPEGWERVSGEE